MVRVQVIVLHTSYAPQQRLYTLADAFHKCYSPVVACARHQPKSAETAIYSSAMYILRVYIRFTVD